MNNELDKTFYKIIKGLVGIQFLLESLDDLKNSKLYKHKMVTLIKRLEKELEKSLGPHFTEIYNRDQESFELLLEAYENIAETLVYDFSLEEIIDLSQKLKLMQFQLNISKKEFEKLEKDYSEALKTNKETFIFQNREIATGYAKYLIEYFKDKF